MRTLVDGVVDGYEFIGVTGRERPTLAVETEPEKVGGCEDVDA